MLYLFCLAGSIGELTAGLAISGCSDYSSGGGWIIDLEVKGENFKFAGDENGILIFEQRLNV